jgi:hypothetical protein
MVAPEAHEQDELDELPPLDGDTRDQPEPEPEYADLLEESTDDATLDDATAEDQPPDASDLDLDDGEGGWLNEAGEAQDLDLGDVAIIDFGDDTPSLDDTEDPVGGEEDLAFGDAPERGGLDAGEEGPLDPDEELREADLPALDADAEGEVDDATLVDPALVSDEPLGLPWAAEPWLRVGSPVAFSAARTVSCAPRGALVLARAEGGAAELVRVDLEGTCERLAAEGVKPAEVRAVAVEGPAVVVVLQAGRVLLSHDGGEHFAPIAESMTEGVAAIDAVLASGRLWMCTRTGGLLVYEGLIAPTAASVTAASPPVIERCAVPGTAVAIARDAGGAASGAGCVGVLAVDDGAKPTAVVRCISAASFRREAVDGPEARAPALFAVRGPHAAYAARRGGVVRRTGAGAWAPFQWEGTVTALLFIDDLGTLVCAAYSEGDDTTAIVRLDAGGNASVVARVGAAATDSESDGRVAAMAHDEATGVVWIAGGFGLMAFAVT